MPFTLVPWGYGRLSLWAGAEKCPAFQGPGSGSGSVIFLGTVVLPGAIEGGTQVLGMGFAVTLASSSQCSLWALERCSRWENGKGVDVQTDRPLGWTWRVGGSPRQLLGSGTQIIWAQKSADITGLAQSKGVSLAWLQLRTGKVMSARCMRTRGKRSWCGGICRHSAGHCGGSLDGM